jgi:putative transcriptional regulator
VGLRHICGVTLLPLELPTPQPRVGALLVAAPLLTDPNFDRTVLLILEHDESGSFAVVINRPSDTTIESVLPEWRHTPVADDVLYIGGPVAPDSALGVGLFDRRTSPADSSRVVTPDLGVIDLDDEPLMQGLSSIRIFSGYAGWEEGQLDDEIDEGAWYVVDGSAADVFDANPLTLWRRVLRRQSSELAFVATHSDDPTLN